jgi:hypothetical protein
MRGRAEGSGSSAGTNLDRTKTTPGRRTVPVYVDANVVQAMVEQSRAEQGLPPKVQDPIALERVRSLFASSVVAVAAAGRSATAA